MTRPKKPGAQPRPVVHTALLTDFDTHLFREGNHYRIFDKLGSHAGRAGRARGTHFAVWAPNAEKVSVIGDFNNWDPTAHPLAVRLDSSGIWEGLVPGVKNGARYKYHIVSRLNGYTVDKGDPLAFFWETPPATASCVWDPDYEWHDQEWVANRKKANSLNAPLAVYEVHLGSWRRATEEAQELKSSRVLSYREIAPLLAEYVLRAGFTHVEFMPVMEHPFYGSWGYQVTGYFAPTSRYGTPQDFMYLVDYLHQQGIGVILDWVPSHFPDDAHGLAFFDGTHLYEHQDPRQGFHPEWTSCIFNYSRNEVRSFLVSSALFWLEKFHADGLRVDAVASMLYLDYARKPGEWIPNVHGGRENLEAIAFLKQLNEAAYREHPDVQMIAEESSAWPMVSRPTWLGGLGFGIKWDMGWMHDTLEYFGRDPIYRKYHQNLLTFGMWYAFNENFMLPLSHDEVVYGKRSLLNKMPGDDWRKFANLRLLLGYMYTRPGKKLLFMGDEFGQWKEWDHENSLDWHLLESPAHEGILRLVQDLNQIYRREPELHELDCDPEGFQWIDLNDAEGSTISYVRRGSVVRNQETVGNVQEGSTNDEARMTNVRTSDFGLRTSPGVILVACNFTPVPRHNYRVGVPWPGFWQEILNTDATVYGGSGLGNAGGVTSEHESAHGREDSLSLLLPPLAVVVFRSSSGQVAK